MAESLSTKPEPVERNRIRRARAIRRAFFLAVCALLLAAVSGMLGVSDGTVKASGGGYDIAVEYPRTTRPGLATALTVTITHRGGWDQSLAIAFSSSYFDNFDVNGVDPEPMRSTADGERLLSVFHTPPQGDTLSVSFDARTQPGVGFTRAWGTVSVVENGRDVATARFRTTVLP